ncbi:unnamed protein product [Pseudo-nitzschia multistriata]|uniref:RING-type E3 ubiquitin transferase n=1 Tax=Pseudo-nitzschia multistriata TaxID=183589 RepID=A0A448ZHQ6_9STRA|nr:unnamed protein product [Pseudo-nitzschia multistriata]
MASSGNPLGHPAAGWTGMGAPFASTSHSVPDEIICYNAESSMGRMIDHYSQFLEPVINCCADEKECAICLDVMSPSSLTDTTNIVCLRKCKHRFHKSCIIGMLEQNHTKCPFCRETIAAESQGLSPSGKLTISLDLSIRCQGSEYDSDGVIVLQYSMPEGIQAHYMENPFMRYAGTSRRAYLPHNESGRALLKRLKYAFTHGLTFRVGTSLTTGKQNQITWASIHHKTSLRSGPHGYPDPQYLRNCNDSLDALHVPKGEDCP